MHHAPCTIHCSKVDVIEVVWPDGACAVLSASVTIDTLHTVAYPVGSGDSTAACSNVTSANGGAARLVLVMRSACTAQCGVTLSGVHPIPLPTPWPVSPLPPLR